MSPSSRRGVPGAALKGALLTFADTLVGSPLGQSPQGTHGLDADDLISGHYELGHAPVEVLCQPEVGLYDFDVGKALVFRKIPNFDDGDPLEPSARPGWAELVTLVGTRPAVVRPDGVALFVDDRLGPVLRARLQQPGLRWVQRAEANPLQGGAELDFPLAVALELDGSDIVDAATLKNGKLLSDADRGFERVDVVGSPHADDFVGVLSGARRGLFVVGGQRPGTSTPTGEIWFTGLSTARWILLRTGFRPARALAATFSYATDELYVLDELDDQLRLTAIEQATWRSRELARWQHAPEFDAHHLTLELDGGLLLSASSSTLRLHSYARLRPSSGPHELLLEGFGVGVGALASAPIIDANGVSFVLETLVTPSGKPIPGEPKAPHALGRGVALERVRELSLLDGSIEDLEGLL
jgi:hypothetical protein